MVLTKTRKPRVPRRGRPYRKRAAGPMMRKRRGVGRARVKRTSDYAKCVEIIEDKLEAISNGAGESTGDGLTFCLQDFQRPQEIAHAYKYFRASKVEITFVPYFNIAQTGGLGVTQLPQLYMSVDRVTNMLIQPTESEMLSRGVSPKLFTRKQRLTFKPNLLQGVSLETRQPADGAGNPLGFDLMGYQNCVPLFNKWLPTQQSYGYANGVPGQQQTGQVLTPLAVNPYALQYHGAIWVCAIEGQPAGTVFAGDIQVKVTWEFKGPRALKTNAPQYEPNPYVATSSQGNPSGAIPNTQPTTYP